MIPITAFIVKYTQSKLKFFHVIGQKKTSDFNAKATHTKMVKLSTYLMTLTICGMP